jgi:hypothetical protein
MLTRWAGTRNHQSGLDSSPPASFAMEAIELYADEPVDIRAVMEELMGIGFKKRFKVLG